MNSRQGVYLVKEAFRTLRRHRGITALAVIIMSLTLLILAVFLLVTDNMLVFMNQAKRELAVYVYLEEGLSQAAIEDIYKKLLVLRPVETIVFVSKNEALDEFKRQMGEEKDLVQFLESNPLPASFRINLKDEFKGSDATESFAREAEALEGVEEVNYGKDFLEKFSTITRVFFYIDVVLGVIVLLSSIFIISNTVRLAIISRQKSIEILKLVGATNRFITTPFIIEGAFQGGIAALASLGMLLLIYVFTRNVVPDAVFFTAEKAFAYIIVCIFLGALGSYTAMRRYLKL